MDRQTDKYGQVDTKIEQQMDRYWTGLKMEGTLTQFPEGIQIDGQIDTQIDMYTDRQSLGLKVEGTMTQFSGGRRNLALN